MNDMNVAVSYITLGTQLIANGSISVEIDHYDGMKQLGEMPLFSHSPLFLSVHEELEVYRAAPFANVMLHSLCPCCTLNVDKNPRCWVFQLHHHNRLQVSKLVAVGKEVGRKSSPRSVGDAANVLLVGVTLAIAVKPHHV